MQVKSFDIHIKRQNIGVISYLLAPDGLVRVFQKLLIIWDFLTEQYESSHSTPKNVTAQF